MSKIILISGPTASGKSKFALKIAKKVNGEIINADSMQVYKHFKVLTARPSKSDQKKIRHHLYGFIDVDKTFSSGQWLKLTIKKIKDIEKREKIPIIVGGTGLYFQSLLKGLVEIPSIPKKLRLNCRILHKQVGQKRFYKKLLAIDKKVKGKLNPNDTQRSIRAYEIIKFTKKSMYDWFDETKPLLQNRKYEKYYMNVNRVKLLEKIEKRVKMMIKDGAIKEVKKLLNKKIPSSNSSSKVIGFKEIKEYLNGDIDLKELNEKMIIKTRQYAKRQNTWANSRMKNWKLIKTQA